MKTVHPIVFLSPLSCKRRLFQTQQFLCGIPSVVQEHWICWKHRATSHTSPTPLQRGNSATLLLNSQGTGHRNTQSLNHEGGPRSLGSCKWKIFPWACGVCRNSSCKLSFITLCPRYKLSKRGSAMQRGALCQSVTLGLFFPAGKFKQELVNLQY